MELMKQFTPPQAWDYGEWNKKVEGMTNLLDLLATGKIPNNRDYTINDLKRFCLSLVSGQRNDVPPSSWLKPGSWCVTPYTDHWEGEERFDFVYKPTFLAIAILTFVLRNSPAIVNDIPKYKQVLQEGYKFAAGGHLRGHGYDAISGMIKAINTLDKGGVIKFAANNPLFSPEMYKVLKEIKKEISDSLKRGWINDPWSGHTDSYTSVSLANSVPPIVTEFERFQCLFSTSANIKIISNLNKAI